MKGRKPKLAGTAVGHRRHVSPMRIVGAKDTTCPPELTGIAADEWSRMVADFKDAHGRNPQEADRSAIVGYCVAFGLMVLARKEANEITYGANDLKKKNPAVGVVLECLATMRQYLAELGLTPASRSKVSNGVGETEDPYDALRRRAAESA